VTGCEPPVERGPGVALATLLFATPMLLFVVAP